MGAQWGVLDGFHWSKTVAFNLKAVGRHKNANSSHGSSSRIEFGHQIGWRQGKGQRMMFAPFAARAEICSVVYKVSVESHCSVVPVPTTATEPLGKHTLSEWWHMMANRHGVPQGQIWKERNARTFNLEEASTTTILAIKGWGEDVGYCGG